MQIRGLRQAREPTGYGCARRCGPTPLAIIWRSSIAAAESWKRGLGLAEMASDAELANAGSRDAHRALAYQGGTADCSLSKDALTGLKLMILVRLRRLLLVASWHSPSEMSSNLNSRSSR